MLTADNKRKFLSDFESMLDEAFNPEKSKFYRYNHFCNNEIIRKKIEAIFNIILYELDKKYDFNQYNTCNVICCNEALS